MAFDHGRQGKEHEELHLKGNGRATRGLLNDRRRDCRNETREEQVREPETNSWCKAPDLVKLPTEAMLQTVTSQ